MQSLTLLSKEELLKHAKLLVEEDRKISLQLIEVLRECEKRMLYAELGYGSLWQFAVEHLGLSEGSAQLRISAMRLTRENPDVKTALESGKLSLSNAAQLHSFFQAEKKQGHLHTSQSKKAIIESVTGLSKKDCERHLFTLAPNSIPQEKERSVSDSKTELKLILANDVLEKLQKLKNLLAHQLPQATHSELIEYLADQMLENLEKRKSGSKKKSEGDVEVLPRPDEVKRSNESGIQKTNDVLPPPESLEMKSSDLKNTTKNFTSRVYIPVSIRQFVWRRAGGQCEYLGENGVRCKSRHQLELDHIVALAAGGTHHSSNYRYVCRHHNVFEAKRTFGDLMQNYVPSLR